MDVVEIPTHRPIARMDLQDSVYKTRKGKLKAIVREIARAHASGQPILVGTITIEASEELSAMLKREGIPVSMELLPLPPIWQVVVRILSWTMRPVLPAV